MRKTSPTIGFILENYFFYHFIEAVDDAFIPLHLQIL